jgi:hypothetical protein
VTSPTEAIFQLAGLKPSLFAANSRYQGIPIAQFTTADGRTLAYLRRRFVPQPGQLTQVQQYTVTQGDRLDLIAARFFADPQLFWRICDANGALQPDELTATIGRVLRICLPEALRGGQNAP